MKGKKKKNGKKRVIISSTILVLLVVLICFLFVPLFKGLKYHEPSVFFVKLPINRPILFPASFIEYVPITSKSVDNLI